MLAPSDRWFAFPSDQTSLGIKLGDEAIKQEKFHRAAHGLWRKMQRSA